MNIEEKRIYEFDCIFSQLSILANVWQRLNISTKHISPDSDSKRCVLSENTYTTLYILARHDSPSGSSLHDSRVNQDATGIKVLTGTGTGTGRKSTGTGSGTKSIFLHHYNQIWN